VKAFLLCRNVDRTGFRDNFRLDGLFTRVYGRRFPLLLERCFLFIRLSGAQGTYHASVRLVYVPTQVTLAYCTRTPFEVDDRLETKDFVLETPNLVLPWAGRYDVELFVDDRLCETATFDVVPVRRKRRDAAN